ncbi:ParA family protein (plasmid) [Dyella sp. BiH032]|uniref:ParA family protein n=1 Tax=Dyella sp. BiH032 TaxID=3075430 RepID=UPI00289353C9|nr:ParA family protein [Dyella sp. BiH032]WNL48579.1 ParA family protein [Dyella sp. BiH032]
MLKLNLNVLARHVVIACSNLKGGEGKTTVIRHLIHFAAEVLGFRVLAVDLDPQGNLSDSLIGFQRPAGFTTTAELFGEEFDPAQVKPVEVPGSNGNIFLLPSDHRLDLLAELDGDRKVFVKRASSHLRAMAKNFDIVLIDTPTNAPLCYLAGLAAADGSVSPVQMDTYGLTGATRFQQQLQRVRSTYNPRHRLLGFVVNRFNTRAKSHGETLANAREKQLPILQTVLKERVAVQDALARAMPVWRGPRGTVNRTASQEFKAMCQEVLTAAGVLAAEGAK